MMCANATIVSIIGTAPPITRTSSHQPLSPRSCIRRTVTATKGTIRGVIANPAQLVNLAAISSRERNDPVEMIIAIPAKAIAIKHKTMNIQYSRGRDRPLKST